MSPSTTSRSGGGAGCAEITDLQTSNASEAATGGGAIPGPGDSDVVDVLAAEGRPDLPGDVQPINSSTRHSPVAMRLSRSHPVPGMHPLSQNPATGLSPIEPRQAASPGPQLPASHT
jgi:hypothetical protein